jgi:hypothetical protein
MTIGRFMESAPATEGRLEQANGELMDGDFFAKSFRDIGEVIEADTWLAYCS